MANARSSRKSQKNDLIQDHRNDSMKSGKGESKSPSHFHRLPPLPSLPVAAGHAISKKRTSLERASSAPIVDRSSKPKFSEAAIQELLARQQQMNRQKKEMPLTRSSSSPKVDRSSKPNVSKTTIEELLALQQMKCQQTRRVLIGDEKLAVYVSSFFGDNESATIFPQQPQLPAAAKLEDEMEPGSVVSSVKSR